MAKKQKPAVKEAVKGESEVVPAFATVATPAWIAVVDRLPPEGMKVLVYSDQMWEKMDDHDRAENPDGVFFGVCKNGECSVEKTSGILFEYWMPCPNTNNI